MFIGENRVNDSILTLRYDKFLKPRPDRTIIYCSDLLDIDYIKSMYDRYQIDTQGFEFCYDRDLLSQHTNGDLVTSCKHSWYIKQQLYKLIALYLCDDDHVLIADCDTFCVRPYEYFDHGSSVVFGDGADTKKSTTQTPNGHPEDCYKSITYLTGINDFRTGCWATEYMPITKSQWNDLKNYIQNHCNLSWVAAILESFNHCRAYDFSEYCLLAQWLLRYNDTQVISFTHVGLDGERYKQIKNKTLTTNFKMYNGDRYNIDQLHAVRISRHAPFTLEDIDYIYNTLASVLPS